MMIWEIHQLCVVSLGYTSRLKCVVTIMDDDTLTVAEKKEKAKHCMKEPFKLLSTGDPCAGEVCMWHYNSPVDNVQQLHI